MTLFQKFVSTPRHVDAVQVSETNMVKVARWCEGEVVIQSSDAPDSAGSHIKVKVFRPSSERLTQAFVGDWVVRQGKSFKVYLDTAFQRSWLPVEEDQGLDQSVGTPMFDALAQKLFKDWTKTALESGLDKLIWDVLETYNSRMEGGTPEDEDGDQYLTEAIRQQGEEIFKSIQPASFDSLVTGKSYEKINMDEHRANLNALNNLVHPQKRGEFTRLWNELLTADKTDPATIPIFSETDTQPLPLPSDLKRKLDNKKRD